MPELKPGVPCLLWEKTKDLAKERGFIMSQKCPMDNYCEGRRCVYLSTPSSKREDKELSALRRELTKLMSHG